MTQTSVQMVRNLVESFNVPDLMIQDSRHSSQERFIAMHETSTRSRPRSSACTSSFMISLSETSSNSYKERDDVKTRYKEAVATLVERLSTCETSTDKVLLFEALKLILDANFASHTEKELTDVWNTLYSLQFLDTVICLDVGALELSSGSSDIWGPYLRRNTCNDSRGTLLVRDQVRFHIMTRKTAPIIFQMLSLFHEQQRSIVYTHMHMSRMRRAE